MHFFFEKACANLLPVCGQVEGFVRPSRRLYNLGLSPAGVPRCLHALQALLDRQVTVCNLESLSSTISLESFRRIIYFVNFWPQEIDICNIQYRCFITCYKQRNVYAVIQMKSLVSCFQNV